MEYKPKIREEVIEESFIIIKYPEILGCQKSHDMFSYDTKMHNDFSTIQYNEFDTLNFLLLLLR